MARPICEIRLGLIRARVFSKRTCSGVRYTTTVVRRYRNGDHWKESHRFGRDDIPAMRLALDRVYDWILRQNIQNDVGSPPANGPSAR